MFIGREDVSVDDKIMVSICCLAYNHEKYIKDALDSFLKQKTNFEYEVLIHEDASTDNTAAIIKEYEKKYPKIIKPIYQKENQYSKGINISPTIQYPRVKGKYIAICEGDDFWTDPYKLQKQVDYLEKRSECSLLVHASKNVTENNEEIEINSVFKEECDVCTEDIINGGGELFATNSMFFRKKYTEKFPSFYLEAHIGDYPLTIYLSLCGIVHYMPEVMSAYRRGVPGSWTEVENKNIIQSIRNTEKMLELYDKLDRETDRKYHDVIEKKKKYFKLLLIKKKIILKYPKMYKIYRKIFRHNEN